MFRLLLLSCAVLYVNAYSSGAPQAACDHLRPGHGSFQPQSNARIPYNITVQGSDFRVEQGGTVDLTLHGSSFNGFIIVAEYIDSNGVRGRTGVFNTRNGVTKDPCGDGSGLTHSSGRPKSRLDITWVAPRDYLGDVSFWGSFVRTYNTFWIEIASNRAITVIRPKPTTTTQRTTEQRSTLPRSTLPRSTLPSSTIQRTTMRQSSSIPTNKPQTIPTHAVDPNTSRRPITKSSQHPTTKTHDTTKMIDSTKKPLHPQWVNSHKNHNHNKDGKAIKTGASVDQRNGATTATASMICLAVVTVFRCL